MIDKRKLERLREVHKLLDEGEISESDYQNQKKKILELNRVYKKGTRSGVMATEHKKRKKFAWISLTAILVFLIFLIGLFMSHSNASNSNKAKSNTTSSKKTSQKVSDLKSSDSVKIDKKGFNDLTQQQQLGVLIYKELVDANIPIDAPDKKIVYMGEAKKIVVYNEVGVGGPLNHSFMFQDNDSTFDSYNIETTAQSNYEMSKDNSYWGIKNTYSKAALYKIYQENKPDVEKIIPLIDLSHSSEKFNYLQTDQTSDPSGEENKDNKNDDYFARKAREPNAEYTLADGTHIKNDENGNSYNVDTGQVIGK